jgi:hypothetical protein
MPLAPAHSEHSQPETDMRAHHASAIVAVILVGFRQSLTREKMNPAKPNLLNTKRVGFALQSLTAILITFAAGFVLLQFSVRFGSQVDVVDAGPSPTISTSTSSSFGWKFPDM